MTYTKEIIFGTKNPAKIDQVRGILSEFGIGVIGLGEFSDLPDVDEDSETVVDNAVKKSVTYARAVGRTVFSMDNGLYFDGIPDDRQPGMNVRRVVGDGVISDVELLDYYVRLVNGYGGNLLARWEYGLAIAKPNGEYVTTVISNPRLFSGTPSRVVIPGYPLESLQVDPDSGEYVAEMSAERQAVYWRKEIGKPLADFVVKVLAS